MPPFSKLSELFRSSKDSSQGTTFPPPTPPQGSGGSEENNPPIALRNELAIPSIEITEVAEIQGATSSAQSCATCKPLADGTGIPVSVAELVEPSSQGCSICAMFVNVLETTRKNVGTHQVSSWRDRARVYGLYVAKTPPEEDANNILGAQAPEVIVLAANGGERAYFCLIWFVLSS
jgi:hypothetical protein